MLVTLKLSPRRENRFAQNARSNGIRSRSPVATRVPRAQKTDRYQRQAADDADTNMPHLNT